MDRRYPPLRSAGSLPEYVDGREPMPMPPKRRRTAVVSIACNDCRRRKCDGNRPVCSNCEGSMKKCEYRDESGLTKEASEAVMEMLFLLNSVTSPDVAPLLCRLKAEPDASAVLAALRVAQGSASAVDGHRSASVATPEAGPAVENEDELAAQYHAVYPPLAESDPGLLDTKAYQGLVSASGSTKAGSNDGEISNPPREDNSNLCDPRLRALDIAQWTSVDITSDLAARCISFYLTTDHPLLGHFDPNLFLSDLVSGETQFCSRLLVNSLLYWGSQMYSAIEPHTDKLTLLFCQEAEMLWDRERSHGNDTATNLAAAVFLGLGYLGQGRDHSVLKYMAEATEMGTRMSFFGMQGHSSTDNLTGLSINVAKGGEGYTAWGVFNWTVLMSLFYHQPGVHTPSAHPQKPIPHTTPEPPSHSPYMGYTFPYLCRFWKIIHEVTILYQEEDKLPWGSKSSISFAEFKFRELLAWSKSLPRQLDSQHANAHDVQTMHIWFHAAVLDIFRPIIRNDFRSDQPFTTFNGSGYTPRSIYLRSTAQLKRLVVDYRLNYASSCFSILWHTALIYVANAILDDEQDENWYYYMLFCFYGYQRLSKSWRVARSISKGLLSMVLSRGRMTGNSARRLLRDLDRPDGDAALQEIRATFMLDLSNASSPEPSTAEHLAESFDANADMQDYTNVFSN